MKQYLVALLLLISSVALGQQNEFKSPSWFSGTHGLGFPAGTQAQRPSTPLYNQFRYNTTAARVEVWTGSEWKLVPWDTDITNTPTYTLPIATPTTLGGVKPGSGLSINPTTGVLDVTVGGVGTVTSVGINVPPGFTTSGSPITTSGVITISTSLSGLILGTGSGLTSATVTGPLTLASNALGIQQASSTQNGFLATADYNIFNQKVGPTRSILTANSLTGGGDLSANRTLQLVNDAAAPGNGFYYGTNTSGTKGWFALPTVSGATPIINTGGVISILTASSTQNGALSSTDYNVFTAKVGPTRSILTTNSITGGGDLSANRTLQLVNDAATPGASTYYGTNAAGTKGWYALPTGGGGGSGEANTASNVGTGVQLFQGKTGVNLAFRTITAVGPVQVAQSTNEVSISMPQSSSSASGFLSATDFATFLARVAPTRAINTANSITGGGTLAADRTLQLVGDVVNPGNNMVYGTNSGGTRGWYAQSVYSGTAPITITGNAIGINLASGSQPGAISAADYTTFINKVGPTRTLTGTLSITGGGDLSANRTFSLLNDVSAPGNLYYYGTNASGTKGWFLLPTSAVGEANTASNLGSGAPVFASKSGVDLRFRSISTSGVISVGFDANTITLSVPTVTSSINGALTFGDYNTLMAKVGPTRTVNTGGSLSGGGNLSADRTLTLINDNVSPGVNSYYGTDESGNKGWQSVNTSIGTGWRSFITSATGAGSTGYVNMATDIALGETISIHFFVTGVSLTGYQYFTQSGTLTGHRDAAGNWNYTSVYDVTSSGSTSQGGPSLSSGAWPIISINGTGATARVGFQGGSNSSYSWRMNFTYVIGRVTTGVAP